MCSDTASIRQMFAGSLNSTGEAMMDLGMGIVVDREELCFGERGSRASRSQLQQHLALTGLDVIRVLISDFVHR